MIFMNNRTPKSHHSRETNRKNMAGILSYEPTFDRKIADNFGYVSSVKEAYKLIAEFETRSKTKFYCFKVDKDFGNNGVYLRFIYKALCTIISLTNLEFLEVNIYRLLAEICFLLGS